MKISDLMDKEQMSAAYEAGKRLAKIVNDMNLVAKQAPKKSSFGEFFKASLPQPLAERKKGI